MAASFKRKGSRLTGRLDEQERAVVTSLLAQTRELVAPEDETVSNDPLHDIVGSWQQPEIDPAEVAQRDPALQRLLPPASREDDDLATDFRAMTEDTLRRRKAANISTAVAALDASEGDRVELDLGQAQALMIALSDVRLVLGERLGLRTDEDSERLHQQLDESEDYDDPQMLLAAYYDFLTWLQESVAVALMS